MTKVMKAQKWLPRKINSQSFIITAEAFDLNFSRKAFQHN